MGLPAKYKVQSYQLNRLIECLINANYLHYSCKIRLTYCKYPVFLSPLRCDTVSKDLIGNPVRIRNNTRCCISHTGIPGDSATATAARREGAESGKSQKTGRYAIKAHRAGATRSSLMLRHNNRGITVAI